MWIIFPMEFLIFLMTKSIRVFVAVFRRVCLHGDLLPQTWMGVLIIRIRHCHFPSWSPPPLPFHLESIPPRKIRHPALSPWPRRETSCTHNAARNSWQSSSWVYSVRTSPILICWFFSPCPEILSYVSTGPTGCKKQPWMVSWHQRWRAAADRYTQGGVTQF